MAAPKPTYCTRSDILQWARTTSGQRNLPGLIRRLIHETGKGVVKLGFPTEEGVQSGGWDGTVQATQATAHVPAGWSVWELSVEHSITKKAEDDFTKRTTKNGSPAVGPDGTPIANCTYVQVLLAPWRKSDEWTTSKNELKAWGDVRGYNVDTIYDWVEQAPVTHAWLSELMGLTPYGVQPIESWWRDWSETTNPTFPRAAILAGREKQMDDLLAKLAGPAGIITINAGSEEEALAFIAAVVEEDAKSGDASLRSRTALVDDVAAWRRLAPRASPLVLVPRKEVVSENLAGGHHVLMVTTGPMPSDIQLPPIDANLAMAALTKAGMADEKAMATARIARQSLLTARRGIAKKAELQAPPWAKAPSKLERRIFLVGRWDSANVNDMELLSEFTLIARSDIGEKVETLARDADPLVSRTGSICSLLSPTDAFNFLGGRITADDIDAFRSACMTVFGATDPKFELPPKDWWLAGVKGKVAPYSDELRIGLATTLALLGARGDQQLPGRTTTARSEAEGIVRDVLAAANADTTGRLWMSLDPVLPLLAEAAPDVFLRAVREGAKGDAPVLRNVFVDQTDDLSSPSAHTGLLWALEVCAWAPEYLGLSAELLARLSDIDPGGRMGNRPFASLVNIFMPWYPQTSVDATRRLAALDGLRTRHPSRALRLLRALIPRRGSSVMPNQAPRFRTWKIGEPSGGSNLPEHIEEIARRLFEQSGREVSAWVSVIEKIPDLPPAARKAAIDRLQELSADDALTPEDRTALWTALNKLIGHHRGFPETAWAMRDADLRPLEAVRGQLASPDPAARYRPLFDEYNPSIDGPKRTVDGGFDEYERALLKARPDATAEIHRSQGLTGLMSFANVVKIPGLIGLGIVTAGLRVDEAQVIALLDQPEGGRETMARIYALETTRSEGWPWLERALAIPGLTARQKARLLLVSDDIPRAWEEAKELGDDVWNGYWSEFVIYGRGPDFAHSLLVSRELLRVGRTRATIEMVMMYRRGTDPADSNDRAGLMADALERVVRGDGADLGGGSNLGQLDFDGIFDLLAKSDIERPRLARLEFLYLPYLEYRQGPKVLHQMLAEDPALFVDFMKLCFKPTQQSDDAEAAEASATKVTDDPEASTRTPQDERRAENAYRVLRGWNVVPGRREDGTLDEAALRAWVGTARALLKEAKRVEIGDEQIGRILAYAPPDAEGMSPPKGVRDLFEELQNDNLEGGFEAEMFNQGGITSRAPDTGGDPERTVAKDLRARAEPFNEQWPRAAAILRRLADSYESLATFNDQQAERFRKGIFN